MIPIYLTIINLITFALYGIDKKKAIGDKFRIPERVLIFFAVIGGAFGAFLGMHIFHHKTKKKKFYITIPVFLILWTVLIIWGYYQNHHIVITKYNYQNDKIDEALDGYTIVQVSDLHNQSFGFNEKNLIVKIKNEDPDIIVVTGDTIDSAHTSYNRSLNFLKEISELAPVYFITGNHEKWLEKKKPEKINAFYKDIEEAGINIIDNEVVEISDGFYLIGLADDELGGSMLRELTENLSKDGLKILLAHEPKYYDNYSACGVDLVLTGHVHGGQFIIPGKGGFVSPEFTFFPELYEGEHIYGKTTMIISRGLGNSLIPLRINNYPELVIIKLNKKQ